MKSIFVARFHETMGKDSICAAPTMNTAIHFAINILCLKESTNWEDIFWIEEIKFVQ